VLTLAREAYLRELRLEVLELKRALLVASGKVLLVHSGGRHLPSFDLVAQVHSSLRQINVIKIDWVVC